MKVFRFNLDPTATYRQRACLWLSGVQCGDGFLTISVVHTAGFRFMQDLYGVEEIPPHHAGTRRFQLVRVTEQSGDAPQEQPYVVTVGRLPSCTCDAGVKGFRRTTCKHASAISFLVDAGQLPARQLQGTY